MEACIVTQLQIKCMKFQGSNVLVMMNQMCDKVMTKAIFIPEAGKNLFRFTKKFTIHFTLSIHTFSRCFIKLKKKGCSDFEQPTTLQDLLFNRFRYFTTCHHLISKIWIADFLIGTDPGATRIIEGHRTVFHI